MPRYFFHRLDGGFDPDLDGTLCADLQEARLDAIVYAGASVREEPELVWAGGEMRIQVTNEQGMIVTTVIVLSIDAQDLRSR